MSSKEDQLDAHNANERRSLIWVLFINLAQALVVGAVGLWAQSTGLLGVALDNLGDAGVYAISLYAVGRSARSKAWVARVAGVFLILLAFWLIAEVVRRFSAGGDPIGLAMVVAALGNAATNVFCLRILRAHRNEGAHLKASWIFTSNDMIANFGIVISGIAVMLLRSPIPDLVVGVVVVGIVLHGGWEILEQAKESGD